MAGLEIPAFVIGLTAVITVADKCLSICRVISAAKHYGADVVERLAEFEIEHYRFSLFVRYVKPVLETRAVKSSRSSVPDQEGIKDPIGLLVDRVKNTLQQICDLLKDREVIAIAPGTGAPVEQILTVAGRHQASVPTTSADAILTGSSEVPVSERTSRLATELQKQSFKSRMGFYSTKWRENDNDAWRKLNDRLSGWVDRLYDFLPSTIRDVLAHEALLGLVLEDGGDIAASKLSEMATASKGRYSFLDQAYQLRAALDGFAKNPLQIPGVSMKISMRNVQPDPDQQGLRLWAGTYAPRGGESDAGHCLFLTLTLHSDATDQSRGGMVRCEDQDRRGSQYCFRENASTRSSMPW